MPDDDTQEGGNDSSADGSDDEDFKENSGSESDSEKESGEEGDEEGPESDEEAEFEDNEMDPPAKMTKIAKMGSWGESDGDGDSESDATPVNPPAKDVGKIESVSSRVSSCLYVRL